MSYVKASIRNFGLLVLISIVAILSACAPLEPDLPTDAALAPSEVAPTLTSAPSPLSTTSPSPLPTSTRLPIFGKQVADPQFFRRAEKSVFESPDLYSRGESQSDLDLSQVLEITGFIPMDISHIPPGYEFDEMTVYTKEKSVKQCFNGPNVGHGYGRPLLCITQRSTPFEDFIGRIAEIFYLETREMYFEYVYGGWLSIGKSESGSRIYQWDDIMVPGVLIRYMADGLFMEIAYMSGCDGEGCLDLSDLISIAERQG